jgi:hypothetical protein
VRGVREAGPGKNYHQITWRELWLGTELASVLPLRPALSSPPNAPATVTLHRLSCLYLRCTADPACSTTAAAAACRAAATHK